MAYVFANKTLYSTFSETILQICVDILWAHFLRAQKIEEPPVCCFKLCTGTSALPN